MFTAIALVCLTAGDPFTKCELMNSPSNSKTITYPDKISCVIAYDVLLFMTSDEGPWPEKYIADFKCIEWDPKYPGIPT